MVLQVSNLVKKYGNTVALRGVNLNLPEGRIVGLLGPNGSGKTTLIKILAGILTIDGGMATICDNEIGVKTKALVSYLPDKSFLPASICCLMESAGSAANSPEPPPLQKMQPPCPIWPSLFGQLMPPFKVMR